MRKTLLLWVIVVLSGSLLFAGKAAAQTLVIDENGAMRMENTGDVLGEENEDEEQNKEEKRTEEQQEVRNISGTTRLEVRNGRIEVHIEDEESEEENEDEDQNDEEEPEDENDEVEDEDEDDDEASGASNLVRSVRVKEKPEEIEIEAEEDGLEIRQRRVSARTGFPLSIGTNNELIVTTPAGVKEVTILPDAAIARLLENGILSRIVSQEPQASPGAALAGIQQIELQIENGRLIYEAQGERDVKFLGLLPVAARIRAKVSAETGATLAAEEPWFLDVFGFLFTQ